MAGDQSSAWHILEGLDPSVWTQPVAIRERGRLSLPPEVRRRLPWTNRAGICLATVNGDGSVELIDWAEGGERVCAALSERYAALPVIKRAAFTLAAMDRFFRVTREKGARFTLPNVLRSQLDPHSSQWIRVIVCEGTLRLWSDESWKATRVDRIAALEEAGIL